MAVFVSFSDESEAGGPDGDFLVGGYVAPESEWPFVEAAWQEWVLDGPPSIPFLHMIDVRNKEWREKHGITRLDSQDRISEAIRILSHSGGLYAVTSIIKRSDLKRIIHSRYSRKKDIPRNLSQPDYFCFLGYAVFTVACICKTFPETERVDFVVSSKQNVTHHLHEAHDSVRKWLGTIEPGLGDVLGRIIPTSMEDRLPLQAADVFCWHRQRYLSNTGHSVDHKRLRLLANDLGTFTHYWEPTELQGIADKLMPPAPEPGEPR